jgi:hypothetical protein
MRIASCADLKRAILSTVWREGDPETELELPGWIAAAEEQLAAELRVREMVVRAEEEAEGRYLTLPTDFLEAIDLRLQGWPGPLAQVTREQAAGWSPGGLPRGYAIIGDQLELLPDQTPALHAPTSSPRLIELAYYARPAALVADDDSNPVLLAHPRLYLYAALTASAPHLDHDERLPTWAGLYAQARDAANLAWERARYSGGRLNARIRAA